MIILIRRIINAKRKTKTKQQQTKKNKKNTTGKLEVKKYDPKARKHVTFKESKMK